jgi:glycolate oxidase iron-sulfur subunit
MRDSGFARLLLRTGFARSISKQFEFGLELLEASGGTSTALSVGDPPAGAQAAGVPVMLFKGCVGEGLFKRVNEATMRVLTVNGCDAQAPDPQVCCGALHAHAGDLEGARRLARQNIDAFNQGNQGNQSNAPIVTNAGGCGAMLASYAHLLVDDEAYAQKAKEFSARVRDIGQQLEVNGFRNGKYAGSERTTYDASCHLLHGQHGAAASMKMLWAIPDLNFAALRDSEVCCGGAGVYNLLEPDLSEQVLMDKVRNIEQSGATVLATGNPGCHMQIAAGAKLAGLNLRVCHPVELLDESYRRAGFYE